MTDEQAGFPFRTLAADEGVVFPDHFDHDWRAGSRQRVLDRSRTCRTGVTELHIQPAIDTPEVRALTALAEQWIDDLVFVTEGRAARACARRAGAVLIGYRELRAAMRAG